MQQLPAVFTGCECITRVPPLEKDRERESERDTRRETETEPDNRDRDKAIKRCQGNSVDW